MSDGNGNGNGIGSGNGDGTGGADGPASVLIVDDHPLVRDGVRLLLAREPGLSVRGEAGTAAEARRLSAALRPDLVLLDLDLPDGDAFALLAELASLPGRPAVVALTERDGDAEKALRLGARGTASKAAPAAELLATARDVLAGRVVLTDDVIARLVRPRPTPKAAARR